MTNNTDAGAGLEPEAGGHPAHLVRTAAEQVRAANHTLARLAPVPGLVSGSDVYDTVGALYQLTSRLPQLCKQLAAVLTAAAAQGTLTGPADAPEVAAQWLAEAAANLRDARDRLDAAWQTLGPVGGWLSADAAALAGEED